MDTVIIIAISLEFMRVLVLVLLEHVLSFLPASPLSSALPEKWLCN